MLVRHGVTTSVPSSLCPNVFCISKSPLNRPFSTWLAAAPGSATRAQGSSRGRYRYPAFRPLHPKIQTRGARTRTVVKFDDIPQGAIGGKPLKDVVDEEEPEYPPLIHQVRNNMIKFKHCVLLTRVGGFYEV